MSAVNSCKVLIMINNHSIRTYLEYKPNLAERVYVDPASIVIGRVQLGDDVSVWPGAVIRGDVENISIGNATNVQDNATLHVTHDGPWTPGGSALTIGEQVTVGHNAVLHACTVGNLCLIGMAAVVLDGAIIEDQAMIGAGSVVSPRTRVTGKHLWLGSPARPVRMLKENELEMLAYSAKNYVKLKDQYLQAG